MANKIIECLGHPWVTLLSQDSFYKVMEIFLSLAQQVSNFSLFQVLTEKQHEQAAKNDYNFDHPDAFDFELLRKIIQRLKHFKNVEVPIYNFITHSRDNSTVSARKLAISALCHHFISIEFPHRKPCMGPM